MSDRYYGRRYRGPTIYAVPPGAQVSWKKVLIGFCCFWALLTPCAAYDPGAPTQTEVQHETERMAQEAAKVQMIENEARRAER